MNSKSQLACWGGGGVLGPQPVSCLSLFKKKGQGGDCCPVAQTNYF